MVRLFGLCLLEAKDNGRTQPVPDLNPIIPKSRLVQGRAHLRSEVIVIFFIFIFFSEFYPIGFQSLCTGCDFLIGAICSNKGAWSKKNRIIHVALPP